MKSRIFTLLGLWKYWMPGVFAFSVFLSFFTAFAFDLKNAKEAPLSWEGAKWITASEKSAVLYFRREMQISSLPKKAILKVAATDSLELFINGVLVSEGVALSGTPYWLGAVQEGLRVGENLIAVRVEAKTLNTRPAMILSLVTEDAQGLQQILLSDGHWKVSNVPEFSRYDNADWQQMQFSDTHWDQSVTTSRIPTPELYNNLSAERFLKTKIAEIPAVWQEDLSTASALFSVNIAKARSKFKNAWLAVRCDGVFELSINKRVLGDFSGTSDQVKIINIFQQLSSTSQNRLNVLADCNKDRRGIGLTFLGEVKNGEFLTVPGLDWWVTPLSENGEPHLQASAHPMNVVRETSSQIKSVTLKQDFYSLQDEEISSRITLTLRALKWFGFWMGLFSALMWFLSMPIRCREQALLAHNLVFFFATLAGVICSVFTLDVRVIAADVFNLKVLSGLVGACVLMQLIVFLEFRRYHREPKPMAMENGQLEG